MQMQVELAIDLGYSDKVKGTKLMELGSEVGRMLNGSLKSLSADVGPNSANNASSANSAN